VRCPTGHFTRYGNPLPTTIALIEHGGKLLLLRRNQEPQKGAWDTVGGFIAAGERAESSLVREVAEELGCSLTHFRLLATYDSIYGNTGLHTLGIAYVCHLDERKTIVLSDENSDQQASRGDDTLVFDSHTGSLQLRDHVLHQAK
jgi:ADP-ribose pyrophosphatase YjhB (NUDIX family)